MKKFTLAIFFTIGLLSLPKVNATHFAGAEIYYEHVAGTIRDYCVTVIVYGDLNGAAALPTTTSISYTSTCFAGATVNNVVNQQGANNGYNRNDYVYTNAYACAPYDPNDPNSVQFYSFSYQTCVTLPGNCNDWVFSWDDFARNNAIDNIQTPGTRALYIEAKLNNNLGQNSSPRFTSAPVKQFCVKQQSDPPFPLVQNAVEINGDSVRYTLSEPLEGPNQPIPWSVGYSSIAPISSFITPTIDQKSATFFFSPNNPEVDVLKIIVEEYRMAPGTGFWIFVGSTSRDLQIPVLTICNSTAEKGPSINTTIAGFSSGSINADSLSSKYGINTVSNDSTIDPVSSAYNYTVPIIEYNCFADSIMLIFNDAPLIYTPSISAEENEFRVIGPDGVARPILDISFKPFAGSNVLTNEIYLKLHRPLDANGQYVLQIKRGSDGNTLQDECGFQLPPNQIMLINVQNCPSLEYELENLTVVNDRDRKINWSITDPSYLQPHLFNYWQIGMTVGGNTYYRSLNDINARSFDDTEQFFPDHVDFQNFEYSVQLVQNSDFKTPANNKLITIRLRDTITYNGPLNSTVDFGWNAYNAWDTAVTNYQMWWAQCFPDSSIDGSWTTYEGGNVDYFYNDFIVDNSDPANNALYAFRVDASNNINPPPAGWVSESNWLYVLVDYIELPDTSLVKLFAPNVFTPNNDNQNDRFFISGIDGGKEYKEAQLSVFNRWGQLVYEDDNFSARNNSQQGWDGTSIYTGKKLSNGVYYYTVKFRDPDSNTIKDLSGSVTLLGS